jgi:hypothetical protein
MDDQPQPSENELAQLADGSLPASQQAELRARVERSPELARALAEQQRAVSLMRSVDAAAPDALRIRVEAMATTAAGRRRPPWAQSVPWAQWVQWTHWRPRFVLPAATALAAVVAAVIVLASGGGGAGASGPSLPQTARLALATQTTPPPAEDVSDDNRLSLAVDGIRFPYWGSTIGWRTLGSRADELSGRRILTVFYGAGPYRVGYSIVPGSPIAVSGGRTVPSHGTRFTLLSEGPENVVTWVQSGHTCVIAGRSVSDSRLLSLAIADVDLRVAS